MQMRRLKLNRRMALFNRRNCEIYALIYTRAACVWSFLLIATRSRCRSNEENERTTAQFNKKLYFNSPVINRVVKRFTRDYGAKIET